MVIKTAQPLTDTFIVKAVRDKLNANHRLQRLQDYYEGKHDILMRSYDDPIKPNNRIVVNYCKSIADFLTSYVVGVPIRFDAPQIILDSLNYNDNDETTQGVVLNMNIHGFGVELFYTDSNSIPRFSSIDPRESIFIFDDSIEEIITAYIRFYPKEEETEGYNVAVYTSADYRHYELSLSVGELKATGEAVKHYFKDVPAILYPNNREYIGTFEGVLSLQNALNKLVSDELNDFEGFVDAYMVLTGLQATQKEDISQMKQDRVILLDADSRAEWLIKNVNNDHVRELKETLTNQIRDLGCIPNMEDMGSFGSSGVALRYKLIPTEIMASKQERVILRGIQRKLELLFNVLRMTDSSIGNYTDVVPTFERNFIMLADEAIKQTDLDLRLVEAGLMSRETFLIRNRDMTPEEAKKELAMIPKSMMKYGRILNYVKS